MSIKIFDISNNHRLYLRTINIATDMTQYELFISGSIIVLIFLFVLMMQNGIIKKLMAKNAL